MKKYLLILLGIILFFAGCNLKKDSITDPPADGPDIDLSNSIKNSGFEQSTDGVLPENWITRIVGHPSFNYFTLDKTVYKSGSQSLKIYFDQATSNPDSVSGAWGGIYQTIFVNDLKPGQRYYLNFWYKADVGSYMVRLAKNGDMNTDNILSFIVAAQSDWAQQKIAFTIDSETNYIELWINTKTALAKNGQVTAWIDDVKLTSK